MEDRQSRLQTFYEGGWVKAVSMELLADAGFYFNQERGGTTCYKCNLNIRDWTRGDEPKKRHKERSPKCDFIKHCELSNLTFDAKISSPAYTSKDTDCGRQGLPNPGDFYKVEFNRLVSYIDWPLSIPVDRYDLASSGLYSVRERGGSDAVKCFACNIVIKDWKLGDRPKTKHALVSPSCPLVKNGRTGNQKLTHAEKKQIASLFRECEGGSLSTNPSDIKDKEASLDKRPFSSKTVGKDHFFVNARHPMYYHESKRLQSYQEWPSDHCQQPPQLAGAGFYSTGLFRPMIFSDNIKIRYTMYWEPVGYRLMVKFYVVAFHVITNYAFPSIISTPTLGGSL